MTELSDGDRIRFESEVQNSVSVTQFHRKSSISTKNPKIDITGCRIGDG
jgi:hypothetical protein